MPKRQSNPISAGQLSLLVLTCFFLSGLTGLIYEVLWTRMIVKIIGGAPFAVSIVLTIFMGGLGLGSYLAARKIDRIDEPGKLVRLYGLLELAVGAYGFVLPLLIIVFRPFFAFVYNQTFETFMLYNLLTFIGCAVLLIIPVTCLGATLPILSRFYVSSLSHLGTHTGRLYGLNTVGAGLGALLAGFVFLDWLGLWGSLGVAVALNAAIGLACVIVGGRVKRLPPRATEKTTAGAPAPQRQHAPAIVIGALVIFAVSGFCSMAYEVIWTKLLGLIVGPTTYSFTIVLVTFITGLALGAMFFGWLADRTRRPVQLLLVTQVAAATAALIISQTLGNSQLFFAKLIATYQDNFVLLHLAKGSFLFAFMLPLTLCLGATFPLVGKIFTPSAARVGRSIGVAYAINTIGAVLGSFAAGFIIVPLLGKAAGLSLVIGVQLAAALAFGIIIAAKRAQRLWTWAPGMVLAVALLALCFVYPYWDRHLLAIGKYHRFAAQGLEPEKIGWMTALLDGPEILAPLERSEVMYYGDGVAGTTTVLKAEDAFGEIEYSMANSGKPEASTRGDMPTQTLLAHFPMLFTENARSVMVIGLASGVTAGEILHYPVEQLDVLEISSEVATASDFFKPWNNNVLSDPRTTLIVQDGRAHLGMTDRRYDVIISEPSNPWMAGLATLFTKDCFTYARDRLTENGMLVQFIHAYQMDWPSFSLVGRTFAEVFPNSMLVATAPSAAANDFLLVGIKGNRRIDLDQALRNLTYAQRSSNANIPDPRILYHLIRAENLAALFGTGPINSDSRPRLEFAAPKLMFVGDPTIARTVDSRGKFSTEVQNVKSFLASSVEAQLDLATYSFSVNLPFHAEVPVLIDYSLADSAQQELYFGLVDAYCTANPAPLSIFVDDTTGHRCALGQIKGLQKVVDAGTATGQTYSYLSFLYARERMAEAQLALCSRWLDFDPHNATAHNTVGLLMMDRGLAGDAARHFLAAVRTEPDNAQYHANAGAAFGRLGSTGNAVEHFRTAVQLRPDFARAHVGLGIALAGRGEIDAAIKALREAIRLDPELLEAREALNQLLAASPNR